MSGEKKDESAVADAPVVVSESVQEESNSQTDVVTAVAERLKFFFSDANVRQDRFIRNILLQHNNQGGYVPVEALLRFNTIKKHTTSADVVLEAAKSLPNVLSVKDDNSAIGRVDPFTQDKMDGNIPVTLYVANLPIKDPRKEEEEGQNKISEYQVDIDQIRDLFQEYGNVALVKLRFKPNDEIKSGRKNSKPVIPVGAALVEFETEDEMSKAANDVVTSQDGAAVNPNRPLRIGNNILSVVTLKDFIEQKKKNDPVQDDAEVVGEDNPAGNVTGKRQRSDNIELVWNPRCVIELKGLSTTCDREAILKTVAEGLNLDSKQVKEKKVYVDFSRGQSYGAIRFSEPMGSIDTFAEKLQSGEFTIDGHKVESAKILEGDEEIKYWQNFSEFKKKQQQHNSNDRFGRSSNKRWKGGKRSRS